MIYTMWHKLDLLERWDVWEEFVSFIKGLHIFQLWPVENDGVSMTTSVLGIEDTKNILRKIRSTMKAYTELRVCKPGICVSQVNNALEWGTGLLSWINYWKFKTNIFLRDILKITNQFSSWVLLLRQLVGVTPELHRFQAIQDLMWDM